MPQQSIILDPADETLELLRCACGSWSRLSLSSAEVLCDGTSISGFLPFLVCDTCRKSRLPRPVKKTMQALQKDAVLKGESNIHVDITKMPMAKKRFAFCTKVNLKYAPLDYFCIPGLERPWDSGFLTPVFFSIEVLPYFQNHPGYVVNLASDTYGTLYTKDGGYISFGLTRMKHLIMWLGDLDKLSERDLLMLTAHNIDSDHDIGSEFYEGQVEAVFTELSLEQRIVRAQGAFGEKLVKEFASLRLLQMDKEAVDLLASMRRPIYFTEEEFGVAVETMTKLFIERIDVEQLRTDLQPFLSPRETKDSKSYRGLSLLQLWLKKRSQLADATATMMPLFVLYDLRVAFKHLISDSRKEELKLSSLSRLGLKSDASLEALYLQLVNSLEHSFKEMARYSVRSEQSVAPLDASR